MDKITEVTKYQDCKGLVHDTRLDATRANLTYVMTECIMKHTVYNEFSLDGFMESKEFDIFVDNAIEYRELKK